MNTTEGGAAVGIEAISATVEQRAGDDWDRVAADCEVEPMAPLLIQERQVFSFRCELADGASVSADIRVVAEADIFGLDQPYRQIIELSQP